MSTYSPLLKCRVKSIEFSQHRVVINLPANDYVDMAGAIQLATSINQGVTFIGTMQKGCPDTYYEKDASGEWRAYQVDMTANLRRRRGNREV